MFGLQRLCGFFRSPRLLQCVRQSLTEQSKEPLSAPSLGVQQTCLLTRCMATLNKIHKVGPRHKVRAPKTPVLDGCPQKRGVVLKVLIKKPKKPNSANRRCVRVRLSNGKEATAYIPGEGHNLQEHSVVLVKGGKLQDTPGVNLVCVRGKYDLAHVRKKK